MFLRSLATAAIFTLVTLAPAADAQQTPASPPAEASVAIVVSTPHRRDAFAAGEWLIDTLKHDVPIWKREQWSDGTTEWVHPGMNEEGETRRGGEWETV